MSTPATAADTGSTGAKPKGKLAIYWAASCGGCEISLLGINEKILDVADASPQSEERDVHCGRYEEQVYREVRHDEYDYPGYRILQPRLYPYVRGHLRRQEGDRA